ncbi:MAG: hypothetical protein IKA09_11695 [Lachnospiraceae bacterium]|nr:hypothetical protein [Lachnospiraceae bacterium]
MASTDKEMERLINEQRKHKGQWLTKEAVDYYYEQAQKCSGNDSQDIEQRRQLRKELQERFGLLEIEAVNILSGVHGAFYVEKYNRIRNCTPLKSESTESVLEKED